MTDTKIRRQGPVAKGLVIASAMLALVGVSQLTGQQLPLKTAAPPGSVLICDAGEMRDSAPSAAAEERTETVRLTNAATQAMILGDLDGALAFLDRAMAADPTATEAVYLKARILQQQGSSEAAAEALCEYLRLDPTGPSAQEVRRRLDEARDRDVGRQLLDTYESALALESEDRLEEAEAAFSEVLSARPAAAIALYNRGVVRAALGRTEDAHADFRRYLELEPTAEDAPEVRRYVAIMADDLVGPRAGAAFFTGALLPGGGQFYTGRPMLGATVTGLAAAALAAGAVYQRTTVRCLDALADPCPADLIASRETDRPLMGAAIGVAAGLALVAAVEAALHAARSSHRPDIEDRISYNDHALRIELVRWHY